MITEKDLHEAIAECQGTRNPNANTCIKLAAYYTILDKLQGDPEPTVTRGYSYDPPEGIVGDYGDTEFLQTVAGMKEHDVMEIMDELMSTVLMMYPKLHAAVIRKLTAR